MKKILGLGNALVDIMTELEDDSLLNTFGLPKGSMQLVDFETSSAVLKGTTHLKQSLASGGSAANTIHGLARLGVETGFIGKVGSDEYGEFFSNDMKESGIKPLLGIGTAPSGRAMALVSRDAERTFATYLGSAIELTPADLKEEIFSQYHILYIEGYLVQNYELVRAAMELARKCNMKVALDLASYNVVEANVDFLREMIIEYVDIVFANEEEAKAFTGMTPHESLIHFSNHCEMAIVKTGSKGSLVKTGDQIHEIGIIEANSIDTTGAGDLYAAGFLYGMVNDLPADVCGRLGALLAGNVIEVIGAKIDPPRWEAIHNQLKMM